MMDTLRRKEKLKLLRAILTDLKVSTAIADAAAAAALVHIRAGRADEALDAVLEVEPKLYDAQHLFSLSTYVKGLGGRV